MMRVGVPAAVAWIRGDAAHPCLHGKVEFVPQRGGTMVIANICGMPDSEAGFFGFHIHAHGNCSGKDLSNTGGHYDRCGREHPRHSGDLPPLLACGGKAFLAVVTGRFSVRDVIGRSVVIHSQPDDFKTQPSGNAGSKIACGVICGVQ